MSLSSFLLGGNSNVEKGKGKEIDAGLDDIFRSTAVAPPTSAKDRAAKTPAKKRKLTSETTDLSNSSSKRQKSERKNIETDAVEREPKDKEQKKAGKSKKSKKRNQDEPEQDHADVDAASTSASKASPVKDNQRVVPAEEPDAKNDSDEDEDQEGDPSNLIHESLTKGSKSKSKGPVQSKYIPPDETTEQRNLRTVFIGNVSVEVAKSRPLVKQLKRHILSFVPSAKIESVRLRSVAFQNPTAALPDDASKKQQKPKETRQHDLSRTSTWRAKRGNGDSDSDNELEKTNPSKTFLTPAAKKRVAFIKHELHSGVDSVNAYVVFAHAPPPETVKRPANVPPPKPVMDPLEAAREVVEKADGSVFLGRTIRVDLVRKGEVAGENSKEGGKSATGKSAEVTGDPKKTVFVGNLDFASKEEDLRVFFEGLVSAERGPPPVDEKDVAEGEEDNDADDADEEDTAAKKTSGRTSTWVKRVRIIRDKDTLLGKGFAYIQFVDRECVDEILSFEPDRLKFAKRKLRVQRCKTLPSSSASKSSSKHLAAATSSSTPASSKPYFRPIPPHQQPRGDPSLGSKISHLSKEERKAVKASDADRLARRLAKKQAKSKASGPSEKTDLAQRKAKAKEDVLGARVKMGLAKRGVVGKDKGKKNKSAGRVRSGKALAKMNTKK